jgi:hypothetical protein
MLGLFKSELSINDILWGLPKKRLFELRDARIQQLKDEQEANEKAMKDAERKNIRDQILL